MIKVVISRVTFTDDESSFKFRHAPGTKSAVSWYSDIIGIARLGAVGSGETEQAKQRIMVFVLFYEGPKIKTITMINPLRQQEKHQRHWSHEHEQNQLEDVLMLCGILNFE